MYEMAVIYAGRFGRDRPEPEIYNSPQHPYTRALLQSSPSMARISTPGSSSKCHGANRLTQHDYPRVARSTRVAISPEMSVLLSCLRRSVSLIRMRCSVTSFRRPVRQRHDRESAQSGRSLSHPADVIHHLTRRF